jgi:hypothetical protein
LFDNTNIQKISKKTKYIQKNNEQMAKKQTQISTNSFYRGKAKKKGKYSKKHSTRKTSKNYKKSYRGQGR